MLGLLAPLLQKQGVDPSVLLAMKGNNGMCGEGGWFMWVIFLFFLMGWGGNGWGGFGGNGRGGIANEINNDYGRSLLMDAIGGNRNALSNLATQLNCTEGQIQNAISALTSQVQNVGNQVGMSGMLPILFETNGVTQAVTKFNGDALTVADVPGTGVVQLWFERDTNTLQLMTGIV